jgi:hypothetical protein
MLAPLLVTAAVLVVSALIFAIARAEVTWVGDGRDDDRDWLGVDDYYPEEDDDL